MTRQGVSLIKLLYAKYIMTIVAEDNIKHPKIQVAPPLWIRVLMVLIFSIVLIALIFSQLNNVALKYGLIGIYCIVLIGIVRKVIKGNYLVTLQANRDGVFFQTSDQKKYFYIPWDCIGEIEKAIFPANARGLRFEVTGEYIGLVSKTNSIGNVRRIDGKVYVYTIPQLINRDSLIRKFLELKNSC